MMLKKSQVLLDRKDISHNNQVFSMLKIQVNHFEYGT